VILTGLYWWLWAIVVLVGLNYLNDMHRQSVKRRETRAMQLSALRRHCS